MKTNTKIGLLIAGVAAWMIARRNKSVAGIGAMRHRTFGGNSGYDGYSMSRRAVEARADGKFPKTDFKKVYHITDSSLNALVELGFIGNNEWHHTSSWGNKTVFYSWDYPEYYNFYLNNKKYIDTLAKDNNLDTIYELFDNLHDEILEAWEIEYKQQQERQKEESECRKKEHDRVLSKLYEIYPDGKYIEEDGYIDFSGGFNYYDNDVYDPYGVKYTKRKGGVIRDRIRKNFNDIIKNL